MASRQVIAVSLLLTIALIIPLARAASLERPLAPLVVAWYVTDAAGTPIDGAWLTIYYCRNTTGPFIPVPANDPTTYVEDLIAASDGSVHRNPVITGYWNPDKPAGIAFADVHVLSISKYYFYVTINDGSSISYWPTSASIKPLEDGTPDPTWYPVLAAGSPSGYAASGNGLGTGPTTAFPTCQPPTNVIPEVPLGPSIAAATMILGLLGYVSVRRRKLRISTEP
jgi:hypothetical protein